MTLRLGLLPLLIPFVALPLASCEKADIERVVAAVKGDDPPPTTALYLTTAAVSSSSSSSVQPVESVSVAVVETASSSEAYVPPPIECVQSPWHGMNYSCDGKTSWPVE